MANRYWVGGTATWNGVAASKWSTTSGGASGASTPTAADDVFFDAASGAAIVTLASTGSVARSVNCTGFTGEIIHTATVPLTLGDSTAGAGNVALLLSATMTYTVNVAATSTIAFVSTSATQQTITTNGKTLGSWSINGAGSNYLLADSNSVSSTATVTLTQGTLNTNSQTCSWGFFSSTNSNTRTLTMGSSAITLTATGTAWNTSTFTNLTVTANTSVVTLTGAASTWFGGSGFNTNGGSIVMAGSGLATVANSFTCANLTRTGTASRTDSMQFNGGSTVVTGTLTITGNSAVNRVLVTSLTIGTACNVTAAAVSLANVDFRDINAIGAAIPFTGTSLGDCLGNTNITFDTPTTRYWVGGGGEWSSTNRWSTTSGGSSGASVPLPQDDVIIDDNSGSGFTFTMGMPRIGKNVTFSITNPCTYASAGNTLTVYGSITLPAALTNSWLNTTTFAGRSSHTVTSNSKSFFTLVIAAPTGTYTLTDAIVIPNNFTLNGGTFASAGFGVTAAAFLGSSTAGAITLNMGSSTWTMTSTAVITVFGMGAGTVTNSSASTIVVANASANTRTFTGTSQTFGTLTYIVAGSTGQLNITGSNTFSTINFSDVSNSRTLRFTSGTTTTITSNFNVNGTAGKPMIISSSTGGSAAILSKSSGIIMCDYLSIQDSTATGGASWYAGSNSTSVSGNSGWIFNNPSDFLQMF